MPIDNEARHIGASALLQERPGPAAHPFRIQVEQEVLDDLQERLAQTRWARLPGAADWSFGTSRAYLQELVEYWRAGYDWRHQEARLNELPQFKARVGATDVHFVHVRGREPREGTPLLLLHGWPDSFFRFHRVIPLLSGSFTLVVPSLPGFPLTGPLRGASAEQPTRQSAELLYQLMTEVLGYARFGVVGGDGGSVLAQVLAIDHPEAVSAIHLTDLGWHVYNADPSSLARPEQKYLQAAKKRFLADMAYAMMQSTRPRSLAAALNDSPVGLASWILDRFHSWSDADGDIDSRFGRDELLTNVMLYWVTQAIGPSMYNYFAEARSPSLASRDRVERPVGLALFPKDIGGAIPPRSLAERTLNVQRFTEMPRGSHFAAWEEPELFARDVLEFFQERAIAR
jgi:pimeloyl-ACP methyl ester carboxylesterase